MIVEIMMPTLSPTMEEGTISTWHINEGQQVKPGDLIAEIETDKAIMEFEAIDSGTVKKILFKEGSEGIKVNTIIAIFETEADDFAEHPKKNEPSRTPLEEPAKNKLDERKESDTIVVNVSDKDTGSRLRASPLARRIAEKKGIDLDLIKGTGPKGRIIKSDIENWVATLEPHSKNSKNDHSGADSLETPISAIFKNRKFIEIPLNNMRKTIASRLSHANKTIPTFYLRRKVTIDKLLALREELNNAMREPNKKISINDFFIKASSKALQDFPTCNSIWNNTSILQLESADIAVAVALEDGLITPIIEDTETKSISEISAEVKSLVARAEKKQLLQHEYVGGAIAISNLGMMGVESFDAVINPPNSSILAIGCSSKEAVANKDNGIELSKQISLTLSVDHRVIDGALGANFLGSICSYIEDPYRLII